MRKSCSTLLACMMALASFFASEAAASGKHKHSARTDRGAAKIYSVQTPRVRHRCFPGKLKSILSHIARQVGRMG